MQMSLWWGALLTLFGLQQIRTLFPLLVFYLKDWLEYPAPLLAVIALALFLSPMLLIRLFRQKLQMVSISDLFIYCAVGIIGFRVASQFIHDPGAKLLVCSGGVFFYSLSIPLSVEFLRQKFSASFALRWVHQVLLGCTLDLLVRSLNAATDLPWLSDARSNLFLVLLAIAAGVFVYRDRSLPNPTHIPTRLNSDVVGFNPSVYLALGAWNVLYFEMTGNLSRFSAISSLNTALTGCLFIFSMCVGYGLALGQLAFLNVKRTVVLFWGLFWSLILTGTLKLEGLALQPEYTSIASLWYLGLIALSTAFFFVIVNFGISFFNIEKSHGRFELDPYAQRNWIFGQALFVLSIFLYYFHFQTPLPFAPRWLLLGVGAIWMLASFFTVLRFPPTLQSRIRENLKQVAWNNPVPLVFLGLSVVPLVFGLSQQAQSLQKSSSVKSQKLVFNNKINKLNVATYNIHQGFDPRGKYSLKQVADVLRALDADIIALQEVSRGWVINGSNDQFESLRTNLGYPYAKFAPTADVRWGNAIFSRYPITDTCNYPLPPRDLGILRRVLAAEVGVGKDSIQILATHLHHEEDRPDIRMQQLPVLQTLWGKSPRHILLGDFNAHARSEEIRALRAAGWKPSFLAESSPEPKPTFPAHQPNRRLDYLMVSPDMDIESTQVIVSEASDHLAIVSQVRWKSQGLQQESPKPLPAACPALSW